MKNFLKNLNWAKIIIALLSALVGAIGNQTSEEISKFTEPIAQSIVSSIYC